MTSDTLSDLLRTVRLTGAVFFDIEAAAPWSHMQPPGPTIASSVLPGVQHLISYHAVTAGSCFGGLVGGEPIRLETGDVIVFPHGDPHVMTSAPSLPARFDPDVYRAPTSQLPVTMHIDGDSGARTHLVCGFLGCDDTFPLQHTCDAGASPRELVRGHTRTSAPRAPLPRVRSA